MRAAFGHLCELYEATPQVLDFFEMIADASVKWDGSDPVRPLPFPIE